MTILNTRATEGDHADPAIIHKFKIRGANLTSSYEEEKAAPKPGFGLAKRQLPPINTMVDRYLKIFNLFLKYKRKLIKIHF